jgi:hypothetical protein
MNPDADASDRLFTFRTVVMLFCGLAVLGLAGYLAWCTSAPQKSPAPPTSVQVPATPSTPTIP